MRLGIRRLVTENSLRVMIVIVIVFGGIILSIVIENVYKKLSGGEIGSYEVMLAIFFWYIFS